MALQKGTEGGLVTVEGESFQWSVRRAPQWFNGQWVGLVITVEPAEDPRKVLVIEYPMPPDWRPTAGSLARRVARPPIASDDFAHQIARAMAAGWDPGSRGKPFVFDVESGRRL